MNALQRPATGVFRVFLSDTHLPLDESQAARTERVVGFLRSMRPAPLEIYLLGDIFEFWYEYPSVLYVQYFSFLHQLARLAEEGTQIHLVTGNHDFWAGPQLSRLTSVQIHNDSYETSISGLRVFMCHGDGLAEEDRAYRFYRRLLRGQVLRRAVGLLSPRMSSWIANRVARFTRKKSKKSDDKDRRALNALARQRFEDGCDVFICAHLHSPKLAMMEMGQRRGLFANVGDWWSSDSYLVERHGVFSLHLDREDERAWADLA